MRHILTTVFLLISIFTSTLSYKILAIFAYSSQSHIDNFIHIANTLSARNNEVTLISPFPDLKVHAKIKMLKSFDNESIKKMHSNYLFSDSHKTPNFTEMSQEICKKILTSDSISSFLKTGKQFDLVIINAILNECAVAIAHLLGNHTILFSAGPIPCTIPSPAPLPHASVPSNILALPSKMSLTQRVRNTASYTFVSLAIKYYLIPSVEKILFELVPNALHIQDSLNNVALYITNTDPVTVVNRPTTPNIISVTCAQCRQPKSLSKSLDKFILASGEQGFIVFSLGSNDISKNLPKNIKYSFLRAFAQLKQNVVWKCEDDSLQTPPNIYITKRIPQQNLLGHPGIRLFITHGGFLSIQEAVYHAVPLIGIPIFADQPGNIAHMVEQGLAGQLDLMNITSEKILKEIKKILDHTEYADRMKVKSSIIRDHHKETVAHGANWIEYVARHDGATCLRTTELGMNVFQYYNVDIILVMIIITCTIIIGLIKIFNLVFYRPKFIKFIMT